MHSHSCFVFREKLFDLLKDTGSAQGILQFIDSNHDRGAGLGIDLQKVLGVVVERQGVQKVKDLLTKRKLVAKGGHFGL